MVVSATIDVCRSKREEVEEALQLAIEFSVGACETGGISLVLERSRDSELHVDDCQTVFVHWHDAGARTGRRVRLDKDRKIKFNVPHSPMVPLGTGGVESFELCDVLIANPPMEMVKPKDLRVPVAAWVLRVKEHADVCLYCGPFDETGLDEVCALCAGGVKAARADLYKCCKCLSPWHLGCNRFMASRLGSPSWSALSADDPFVCAVCLSQQDDRHDVGRTARCGTHPAAKAKRQPAAAKARAAKAQTKRQPRRSMGRGAKVCVTVMWPK